MGLRIVEEASLTDVGRQRQSNEDAYFASPPVYAVADGMGGARAGEVAARIAVEQLEDGGDGGRAAEAQLAEIARAANRKIYELAQKDESRAGMGTTLTAVLVGDRELTIAHVGDSRAYRLRDDELERLTTDHSLVEEFVRQGKLTPEQAEHHPQRSIITRALGPEPEVEVETFTYPGRDGDVYLLCSDGLTSMVSEDALAQILRRRSSLAEAARELVDTANEQGGRDNITVVLFRLGADGDAGVDEDTLSGRETGAVDAEAVRAAVAEADDDGVQAAAQARAGGGDDLTLAIPAREARELRESAGPREPAPPVSRPRPPARPAAPSRRRRLGVAAGILVVALVAAGLYVGSRQFYFLGTDDRGLVTVYRGMPYELPLGVELYEQEYASAVPAREIQERQRERLLDHELRGRGDAVDLVRQLERGRTGLAEGGN